MADVVYLALRFLHIVFGIAWIGGVFYSVGVQRTAMARVEMPARKAAMRQIVPVAMHYIPMAAVLTIAFGTLLYLYMGSFNPDLLLGTSWGQTLFVGLLVASGTFGFGMLVVVRNAGKLRVHLEEERCDHGTDVMGLQKTINRGQFVILGLGLVIIAIMVL